MPGLRFNCVGQAWHEPAPAPQMILAKVLVSGRTVGNVPRSPGDEVEVDENTFRNLAAKGVLEAVAETAESREAKAEAQRAAEAERIRQAEEAAAAKQAAAAAKAAEKAKAAADKAAASAQRKAAAASAKAARATT